MALGCGVGHLTADQSRRRRKVCLTALLFEDTWSIIIVMYRYIDTYIYIHIHIQMHTHTPTYLPTYLLT